MPRTSSFGKPANYPPLTPEEMRKNAIRFIVGQVRASSNAEAREIARRSPNPALREAARLLDERDAERSQAETAAESQHHRSVDPASSAVSNGESSLSSPLEAIRQAGATEPLLGGATDTERVSPALARRPSYATLYAANRRRGVDGQFISRRFARECDKIGDQLRQARGERDEPGGAA